MDELIKIVLTGPESTGKSVLGKTLSQIFAAPYVPEYARIHLEKYGPQYDFDELVKICRQHRIHQQRYLALNSPYQAFIFLDTDLINYHVWQEMVFGEIHPELPALMAGEADHLYLLTAPDIPWQPDPLRENPDNREAILDLHRKEIMRLHRPYRLVTGTGKSRVNNALRAVRELLIEALAKN